MDPEDKICDPDDEETIICDLRSGGGETDTNCQNHPARESGPDVISDEYVTLIEWMTECGFSSDARHMKPANFSETGRGLAATKDLPVGSVVIEVPDSLIITSRTVMQSYLKDIIKQSRLTPLGAICTFLLCERCRGIRSPWQPYISSLPLSYTVPVYWPPDLIKRLPVSLQTAAAKQKRSVMELYRKCRKVLDNVGKLCPDLEGVQIGVDQFVWAWSTVNTRCVYWLQPDSQDLIRDGEDHYALAPYLDLLNHSPSVQVTAAHDDNTRSYRIRTHTEYSAGDQVFINYGPHPNIKLLLEYGFIIPHNPNNVIDVTLEEFLGILDDISMTKSCQHKIILDNQLHRGHAISRQAVTWSLLTATKVMSLEKAELKRWRECMDEDQYISDKHRLTTNHILMKLLEMKSKQFQFILGTSGDPVELMVNSFCEEHRQILESCYPEGPT